MKKQYTTTTRLSIFYLVFLFSTFSIVAQVGINTITPTAGSILDVSSADKGVLIPRIDIADLSTIAPITGGAPNGLLVYNTNTTTGPGLLVWDATATSWVSVDGNKDWKKNGNAGTTAATDFMGTTDNVGLRFRTNNTNALEITNAGSFQLFQDGTAVSPIVSWNTDTDSGMYRIGADIVGLSTGGIERFRVGNNGNIAINKGGAALSSLETVEASDTQGAIFSNITNVASNWSAVEAFNPNPAAGAGMIATGYYGILAQGAFGAYGYGFFGIYGEPVDISLDWAGYFAGDINSDQDIYYAGMLINTSDVRVKKNIRNIDNATATINKLRPVVYDKVIDKKDVPIKVASRIELKATGRKAPMTQENEYGLIAQEIEEILPELVKEKKVDLENSEIKSLKGVNYVGLIPIMLKAIQEQQSEIEFLKKEVKTLQNKID
ncbi:tail fiber domain-containing protein [Marinirhabdus gelatinilytica]|uniref:Endosialidase-like protein n=1 Tax=Marinirhabdus gelatinilytica TaxID=1703343 RepID=A0A370Q650_9FLAO|nr:tail fiber domain-containing protein [Marinirhabdus gelatinilytica]RDK83789.1 endosialidase-like protein [Marinirhabdus gelatinilytica]